MQGRPDPLSAAPASETRLAVPKDRKREDSGEAAGARPRLHWKEPRQGLEGPLLEDRTPARPAGYRRAHHRLAHTDRTHADGTGSAKTSGPETTFPYRMAVTDTLGKASRCVE